MKRNDLTARIAAGLPVLLVLVCVGAAAYFAFVHVPRQRQAAIERWRRSLELVADARKAGIELWVDRGIDSANGMASLSPVRRMLSSQVRQPSAVTAATRQVNNIVSDLVSAQQREARYVVDRSLRVVARNGGMREVEPACLAVARAVLATDAPTSIFHRHAAGDVVVSFAAPVHEVGVGGTRRPPVGVAVVVDDPSRWLYGYVARPPAAARTAEALLVARDGEDALYLSPLRHDRAPPLTFRRPLSVSKLAAQEALGGAERFGAYVDYRGVAVFAVTRRVGAGDWGLVTKIDQDEVLAPFQSRMWRDGLTGGGLLLAVAGLSLLFWRAERLSSVAAVAQSRARLTLLLDQANDAVLFVGLDGRIFDANRRAEESYGYSRRQLLGMYARDLHAEVDRADLEARLDAALRGEAFVVETRHRRADGSTFPVEVSARIGTMGDTQGVIEIVRDITDRKRVGEALRESETALREAQAIARVGNWKYEVAAGRMTWSEQMFRIFGRDPRLGAPGWREQRRYVHPQDWEGLDAAVRAAIRDGTHFQHEFRIPRPDGDVTSCAAIGRVALDHAGEVERLYGTVQDVTDRKREEDELRFQAILLSTEQEASLDGILVVNDEGQAIAFNQRFIDTCGIPSEVVASRSDPRMLEVASSMVAEPDAFLEQVRWLYEHPLETSRDEIALLDGRILDRYSAPMVGADGRFYGRVWYFRDITDRRRAEEALRESEERYRLLVEQSPYAIGVHQDGRLIFVNPAAVRLFGATSADELVGRPIASCVHPEEWPAARDRIERMLAGEAGLYPVENRYLRLDGSEVPVEVIASEFARVGRTAVQVIAVDATERKRLQAELRQSQKMEAIGRLAGGVAHDFNNLLGVIAGYGSLLTKDLTADGPARRKLDELLKAADRAAALARQLLAFSRRQVVQPTRLDLNAVVADVELMLGRLVGEDVELTVRCAPDLWSVMADAGQIEQIVMNLAINARDAMPGGGRLIIETRNSAPRPEAAGGASDDPHPGQVELIVSDTGHGMDRATRAHLFEPFFTTKEPGKGSGLGLATVHGIVTQNNGRIEVESEPGRGSTFRVFLPRLQESAAAQAIERPAVVWEPELRGTGAILLVEDEEALGVVVSELLTSAGYEVVHAVDPGTALGLAGAPGRRFDVLLTDVIMPRMNGRDLAVKVRELQRAIRVIFMSGYADDLLEDALAPDVAFIPKPFSQTTLLRKLREVLDAAGPSA